MRIGAARARGKGPCRRLKLMVATTLHALEKIDCRASNRFDLIVAK